MKRKLLILASLFAVITACSSNDKSENSESASTAETASTTTENADAGGKSAGEALIAQADCSGCHNKDQKIIGPAYVDIAGKYENNQENVAALSAKVILGGKGVWGDVPMTPHTSLTGGDAKEMVRYILSLKK